MEQTLTAHDAYAFFGDVPATFTRSNGETYDEMKRHGANNSLMLVRIVVLKDGYNIEHVCIADDEMLTVTQ